MSQCDPVGIPLGMMILIVKSDIREIWVNKGPEENIKCVSCTAVGRRYSVQHKKKNKRAIRQETDELGLASRFGTQTHTWGDQKSGA